MPVTYSSYLEVDKLLSLQRPKSKGPEHDEMLFIVIHQVYELWFKQILHELDHLATIFSAPDTGHDDTAMARQTLKRVLTILKTLVAQIDVLETMTPISFASFRDFLEQASGFQSVQFRELEFFLGARDRGKLSYYGGDSGALERLERRLAAPSLYQAFLHYLTRHGHALPDEVFELTDTPPEHAAIRAVLLRVYGKGGPADDRLMALCERLVDLDEGLQEWRYRHVKMVERTIGTKQGTGGSPGAAYLRSTLFRSVFPDLWAIRVDL